MKSTLVTEQNSVIKKKTDSYKQYAFELCLAVFSICDWINEGYNDYKEWSMTYKGASLLTIRKVLNATVDQNTPVNVFRRLDRAIQELEGFDKANMQQYIHDNVSLLADNEILYPVGSILWTEKFGFVNLKPISPKMAIPCTMVSDYNSKRFEYCPDYLFLYESERLLPVTNKK